MGTIQFCWKIYDLLTAWGPPMGWVDTMWGLHGWDNMWDNVETTWGQHEEPQGCEDHMGTTWEQHENNVQTMWGQHGDNRDEETTWGQHVDNMVLQQGKGTSGLKF